MGIKESLNGRRTCEVKAKKAVSKVKESRKKSMSNVSSNCLWEPSTLSLATEANLRRTKSAPKK